MTFSPSGGSYEEGAKIFADHMNDCIRFDYPVSTDGAVFDIGGHAGEWTEAFIDRRKFMPYFFIFEPVLQFMRQSDKRLARFDQSRIRKFEFGFSDHDEDARFKIDDEDIYRSGEFASGPEVVVKLRDIAAVIDELQVSKIDLAVMNIEGGEYRVLNRLVESGKIKMFDCLLLQFHAVVEDAEEQRWEINEKLEQTHRPIWMYPFAWEAWKRKD